MESEFYAILLLVLLPVVLGLVGKMPNISFTTLKSVGLPAIGLEAGTLMYPGVPFETDSALIHVAVALLLSGFCAILGQRESNISRTVFSSTMIVLGLSLGAILSQAPSNRFFLIGILGYAAFSFIRTGHYSLRTKVILLQLAVAIIVSVVSWYSGLDFNLLVGLFLAVTLLPLVPFHLPFLSTVVTSPGTLSGFWIVVWLALGLTELHGLHQSLPGEVLFALQIMALGSAVYASLKSLGQNQFSLLIAYATVAHIALVWGLISIFPTFSQWGIPFGTAVALVMSALFIMFSFVFHRYGCKALGMLSGLASPMPRLGFWFILFMTIVMLLPLIPTVSGLVTIPVSMNHDESLFVISLTFMTIWLLGGWCFTNVLHQTAFGNARSSINYTDLQTAEIWTLALLLVGASYSGVIA